MNSKNIDWLIFVLKAYLIANQHIAGNHTITALIASYQYARFRNIKPLILSLLKCQFIKNVILSNHNPDFDIYKWVNIRNKRLTIINQPMKRGPGYCWELALNQYSDFYLLIDDDFLITAKQIKYLMQHLIDTPDVIHGVSGHLDGNYYQNIDMEVNRLSQIYLISRNNLERYFDYLNKIRSLDYGAYLAIEPFGHEIILSKTGTGYPQIHNIGKLTRCHTVREPGVALHMDERFHEQRKKIYRAVEQLL